MAVNLNKGESLSLAKKDGSALTRVRMGLGWDAKIVETKGLFGKTKRVQKDIDLDASAVLCSGRNIAEIVYYGQLKSRDGSVASSGDNLTGEGDGDDETITVDLSSVPSNIDTIVFTVTSYGGDRFDSIDNAYVRVLDLNAGEAELARYTLTGSGTHTAMVMAKITRTGSTWQFTALGNPAHGKTASHIQNDVLQVL